MADQKLSQLTTGAAIAATDLLYSAQDVGGGLFNQVKQPFSALATFLGTSYQPLDADLTSIAALAGTNTIYYRSAANTWSPVTVGGNLSFAAGTLNTAVTPQASDPELTAIAGLTSAVDQLPYFTGAGTAALTTLTATARTLLDDTSTANMLTTLGAQPAGSYQPLDTDLTAIAGLVSAADQAPYFTGSGAASLMTVTATARTLLDDTSTAAMLTTLGAQAAGSYQPLDADLTAIAGLVTAADRLPYFTGVGTASLATYTAFARTLDSSVDATAALTTLGALSTTAAASTYAPLASPNLTGVPTAPTASAGANNTQLATTAYVDATVQSGGSHPSARLATTAALPANTYANGAAGVGATLTATAVGALSIDIIAASAGDVVLVKNEAAAANNGLYVVTNPGTASVAYVLTRHASMDSSAEFSGAFIPVFGGLSLVNTQWNCSVAVPPTVGTTAISFVQAMDGDLISLAGAGTNNAIYYRSAANTWSPVTVGGNLSFSAGTLNTAVTPQASDPELTAIAGLTSAADQAPYFTGSGTAALMNVTATARTLLDDTSTAAMLTTLGAASSASLGSYLPLAGGTLTGSLTIRPAGFNALNLDSSVAAVQTQMYFSQSSVVKWQIGKDTDNSFYLYDSANTSYTIQIGTGGPATSPVNINRNLTVNAANPVLALSKTGSGNDARINGYTGVVTAANLRWSMVLGWADAESGGNAGSNFYLGRYSDSGAFLSNAITITRSTGTVAFSNDISTVGQVAVNGAGVMLRQNGATYGFMHYHDDTAYYMLLTNSGSPTGGFNGLRPFICSLATGNVTMSHNVSVLGTFGVGSTISAGGDVNVTGVLSMVGGTQPTIRYAPTSGNTQNANVLQTGDAFYVTSGGFVNYLALNLLNGTVSATGPFSTSAKQSTFGNASGTAFSGAVAPADANIKLYDYGSGNWCGMGTDPSGNFWVRTGQGGTPIPAFGIDFGQNITFNGPVRVNSNFTVNGGNPISYYTKGGSGNYVGLQSFTGANTAANLRWHMLLGDNVAEGGSNIGSNFQLQRFSDTGAFISTPLAVTRSTGMVTASDLTVSNTSTFTGVATFNSGASFGSVTGASPTDLSKHISLWGNSYGFNVTPATLNIVGAGFAAIACTTTGANLAGTPTAPTPATADNSTFIATTAFVKAQAYAPLASPTFTGTPAAPNPSMSSGSTQIATTAFVKGVVSGVVTLTYNTSVGVDCSLGTFFILAANNATAFTILNPTNMYAGQIITFLIANSTAGGLGTITWSSGFHKPAFTAPAAGQNRSISFIYGVTGTYWTCLWQSAADTSN